MDVSEVKAALLPKSRRPERINGVPAQWIVAEAALRWVDLLENGERVLWCEAHRDLGVGPPIGECGWWGTHDEGEPCRMVERVLVPVGKERDEQEVAEAATEEATQGP